MTAPTRTRPAPTRRAPRTGAAAHPRSSGRSAAAQRAYSRKSERSQRWPNLVPDPLGKAAVVRRIPFVVVVIVLLGFGLITTLWLSTNSAESSYQLSSAQKETRLLSQQAAALHRDVATMDSAAALARRASELGMVATTDVARLVVATDGTVTVVGKPAPAAPPPAAPPPAAPLPAAPVRAPAPASSPAPAATRTPSPAPAVGAPASTLVPAQAHSEQIQPGAGRGAGR